MAEIDGCSGQQFDPEVARSFTEGVEDFREQESAVGAEIPG